MWFSAIPHISGNARLMSGAVIDFSLLISAPPNIRKIDPPISSAPPYIWKSDPPISSGTEENVTLRCHARGYPEPTFRWILPDGYFVNASRYVHETEFLDDGTNRTRGKILQKDGSLLVFNTRVGDSGIYKCRAVNLAGRDEKSVNLTVNKGESQIIETFVFL